MSCWRASVLLTLVSPLCRANLLSIDFGAQYFKAYLVHHGKIEAVLNLETKRKTPNVVSFREAVRQFGDDASAIQARDYKTTLTFFRYLLGKNLSGMSKVSLGQLGYHEKFYPFDILAHDKRKVPAFKVQDDNMVIEEVAANVIGFAKSLAEAQADGTDVNSVILTVPASATQRQRQAVADAAEIAGFKDISVVHEAAAAAVDLALKLNYASSSHRKTSTTLIFNMGSVHTEISLVQFVPVEYVGQFVPAVRVLASITVDKLGGHYVDLLIAEKMLELFKVMHPKLTSIDKNTRALKKLVVQAQVTKHVLALNNKAQFHVECLYEDTDFRQDVSRDLLDDITAESFAQIGPAVDEVVALSEIEGGLEGIDNVELVGGSWRLPRVQGILLEHINAHRKKKLDLGKHLDAEEAIAEGAAFILANSSAGFRARKIFLTDITTFDYTLSFTALETRASRQARGYRQVFTLFPKGTPLNQLRTIHLEVDFNLRLDVFENNDLVTTYHVKGFGDDEIGRNMKIHQSKPHVSIEIALDSSGFFQVRSAAAVWEDFVNETKAVGKRVAGAELNDAIERPRTLKVSRLPLQVKVIDHLPLPMSVEDKKSAIERRHAVRAFEANVKATGEAKNALEAYIYDVRNTMDTECSQQVWTKGAVAEITDLCTYLHDWLYNDGAEADKASYEEKYTQLEHKVAADPAKSTMEAYIHEIRQATRTASNVTKRAKRAFDEDARAEVIALCVSIEEWLHQYGANAGKAAYNEKYKQLQQAMEPFYDAESRTEIKGREISAVEAAAPKWAGPWAEDAWREIARTRHWADAAPVASANPKLPKRLSAAWPAHIFVEWSSIFAAALMGIFVGSGATFALLHLNRCALTTSRNNLLLANYI